MICPIEKDQMTRTSPRGEGVGRHIDRHTHRQTLPLIDSASLSENHLLTNAVLAWDIARYSDIQYGSLSYVSKPRMASDRIFVTWPFSNRFLSTTGKGASHFTTGGDRPNLRAHKARPAPEITSCESNGYTALNSANN